MTSQVVCQMNVSVLLVGPDEIDEMLNRVEHDRYVFEIIADHQDGRVIAVVMPAEEPLRAASGA
jgi:hypothetical protein